MRHEELRELALDTLFGRRMKPPNTCLVVNQAGIELAESSADALPVIEDIVERIVVPTLQSSEFIAERRQLLESLPPNKRAFSDYVRDLVGLTDLLGAFLQIGARFDDERVSAFLRKMPVEIRMRAIHCIRTYTVKPSRALHEFVREELGARDESLRQAAQRVERWYGLRVEMIESGEQ